MFELAVGLACDVALETALVLSVGFAFGALNTLKTHLRSLYQKLGVHSRGEAIEHVWVRDHGDTIDSARLLVAV